MQSPFVLPEEDADLLHQARWIWAENPNYDLVNGYALFRYTFPLNAIPDVTPLCITADAAYRLYINECYVGGGPARGYQNSWPYDRYDIASYLRVGKNLIAIRAFNPGRGTFQYRSEGFAGLLMVLRCGKTVLKTQREGWRCRRQTGIRRDTVPGSLQLPNQEHIDLRIEPPNWLELDFDDTTWSEPITERSSFSPPWTGMEARGLPHLDESLLPESLFKVVGRSNGLASSSETRDALADGLSEGFSHMRHQENAPFVFDAKSDEFESRLIDLGRPYVGRLELAAEDCKGGECLDVYYAEKIDPDSLTPIVDSHQWNRIALAGRIICRKGNNRHTFFHPFGFRYLIIRARHLQQAIKVSCRLRNYRYPLEISACFETSDPVLQKIYDTCVWTQRLCIMDAIVDTPWREQAQWWGDARIQGVNLARLSNDLQLIERGAQIIANQTTADGLTYGTAPGVAHGCVLPDFSLTWILSLWDHYQHTGALTLVERHWEQILRILSYFQTQLDSHTGLVMADPRYWLFLDWAAVQKDGHPTLLNLMLLETLLRVRELAILTHVPLSRSADFDPWISTLRGALSKLVNDAAWICEGIEPSGRISSKQALLSQVIAIETAVPGINETVIIKDGLLPFLRGEPIEAVTPNAAFCTRILSFLIQRGYGIEVLDYIRRMWSPMITDGGTWEQFDNIPGRQSYSHAWSAHPLVHLQEILGGVRPLTPGWTEISFAPHFYGKQAKLSLMTPKGLIYSAWIRNADTIKISLQTPDSIAIHVRLPDGQTHFLAGGHYEWEVPVQAIKGYPY